MTRNRRVGTLTLGLCLVIIGMLFIFKTLIPSISYEFLLNLWPLILIFLGLEVILGYTLNKEHEMKYDVAAFFLIIVLTFFSIGIGTFEYVLTHAEQVIRLIR